jgi:hypothetical protein
MRFTGDILAVILCNDKRQSDNNWTDIRTNQVVLMKTAPY